MSEPHGPGSSRPGGPPDRGTADRPRQLTMAGWFVVVGSVLVVVSSYTGLSDLNSLTTRERVQQVLSEGAGPGLGLSVDQALSLMRVGLMASGALSAAAAVAGFYVLRRHRGARVLLGVLAVPLLVTTLLTGGLTGALVVAAIATLWSGPARDWYAGRPVRQPRPAAARGSGERPVHPAFRQGPPEVHDQQGQPGQEGQPGRQGLGGPQDRSGRPTLPTFPAGPVSEEPAPTPGWGSAPGQPGQPGQLEQPGRPGAGPVPPWVTPQPGGPWGGPGAPTVREAVPAGVRLACILTWVASGLVVAAHLVFAAVLLGDSARLVDYLVSQPAWRSVDAPRSVLVPAMWFYVVAMVLWSLAACGLAFLVWRRHDWARWLLAISAGVAFVFALAAFPAGVLHQLACAAAVAGLFNARSRAWFAPRPPQWAVPPREDDPPRPL